MSLNWSWRCFKVNADHKLRLPQESTQWPMWCQSLDFLWNWAARFLSFLFFEIDIYYSYYLTHTVCMSRHLDFHCRLWIRNTSTARSVNLLFVDSQPGFLPHPFSAFHFHCFSLTPSVSRDVSVFTTLCREPLCWVFTFFKVWVRFRG